MHSPQVAEALSANGFARWEAGPQGLEATTVQLRGVLQAGDRLWASVLLCEDGRLLYRYRWAAPLLDGEALPPHGISGERPQPGSYLVSVNPSGDPSSSYSDVQVETTLARPEDLPQVLKILQGIGTAFNGPYGHSKEPPKGDYYLFEPHAFARFRERFDGQDLGVSTFWVQDLLPSIDGIVRTTVVQTDAQGNSHRYVVVRQYNGLYIDLATTTGERVHEWIWKLPLQERDWQETDPQAGTVSYHLYFLDEPITVEAGTFERCLRLSTFNEHGQSTHTYAPRAGLIKSEFLVDGTPGSRELCELGLYRPATAGVSGGVAIT